MKKSFFILLVLILALGHSVVFGQDEMFFMQGNDTIRFKVASDRYYIIQRANTDRQNEIFDSIVRVNDTSIIGYIEYGSHLSFSEKQKRLYRDLENSNVSIEPVLLGEDGIEYLCYGNITIHTYIEDIDLILDLLQGLQYNYKEIRIGRLKIYFIQIEGFSTSDIFNFISAHQNNNDILTIFPSFIIKGNLQHSVVMCQKTLDTEYIYLHNSLVGEEKFIVDNKYSIINYSGDLPIEKSKIIQRKLYSAIDSIENFGDGYICPALTKESIQNICSILGRDSVYISFTKRLYRENNTEVWTSNSITIKLREDIKIADFLKKNNIAYRTINVLGENEYSIYLNDVIDQTFDLCNELNEDSQIEYACPNFNFFIEDDEQVNDYSI